MVSDPIMRKGIGFTKTLGIWVFQPLLVAQQEGKEEQTK
jgi:hypothetical protein